jgi:hypothetical protein
LEECRYLCADGLSLDDLVAGQLQRDRSKSQHKHKHELEQATLSDLSGETRTLPIGWSALMR